jgi:hypothetical protein
MLRYQANFTEVLTDTGGTRLKIQRWALDPGKLQIRERQSFVVYEDYVFCPPLSQVYLFYRANLGVGRA